MLYILFIPSYTFNFLNTLNLLNVLHLSCILFFPFDPCLKTGKTARRRKRDNHAQEGAEDLRGAETKRERD